MKGKTNNPNILLKTIVLIIFVAITCLWFFGLDESSKTNTELISFGFIIFTEFIIYVSCLLPYFIDSKKLNSADIISTGILYAIGSFIINVSLHFDSERPLIIYNIIAILIYFLLFATTLLMKKK